jgi:tumor protein p53-inducible protein 3
MKYLIRDFMIKKNIFSAFYRTHQNIFITFNFKKFYSNIFTFPTKSNTKSSLLLTFQKKISTDLPILMKSIKRSANGELLIEQSPLPHLKENEELMKVEAFSINRSDFELSDLSHHQKTSGILGLECSGFLINGDNSKKVMALVNGGAFAEYVAVKKEYIMEVPPNLDVTQAAAIPKAWLTAYALCKLAQVHKGDHVLIHAAASGVGTALIQMVRLFDAHSISIVSSDLKLNFCDNLSQGTTHGLLRKDTSRTNKISHFTHNQGCSVIFDCIGATEFDHNIMDSAFECRWISYGYLSGSTIPNFDLKRLHDKRLSLHFFNLRNSSDSYKLKLLQEFGHNIIPKFERGEIFPVIDTIYQDPEKEIRTAKKKLESYLNIGKIIMKW